MLHEGAGCYRKLLVATGSFWLLQDVSGCYRTFLVATGWYWLLQEAAGCYSKLLVVPVQLFYDIHIRHRKLQDGTKSRRKVQDALKRK